MTGPEFKAIRHSLGLSIAELAKEIGITDLRTIRRMEAGKVKIFDDTADKVHQLQAAQGD
jgi:transcriptional regulator with XRE-family HTH domain